MGMNAWGVGVFQPSRLIVAPSSQLTTGEITGTGTDPDGAAAAGQVAIQLQSDQVHAKGQQACDFVQK
ncbi:MAG TPA: hypothetical protein VJX29_00320 [Candidatus Acidoferrales bacterium]|nr:hypothetical protein [Candidatus Acidoferrales bacterium]